jgi:hypothetical protein
MVSLSKRNKRKGGTTGAVLGGYGIRGFSNGKRFYTPLGKAGHKKRGKCAKGFDIEAFGCVSNMRFELSGGAGGVVVYIEAAVLKD